MKTIKDIKQAYWSKKISKHEFINKMNENHKHLFDYACNIKDTNLKSISINHGEIVAEFSNPSIKMICPPMDNRIAPIEAFNFESYEYAELNLVRRLIQLLGGSKVKFFDVGANAGFYSLALSSYFQDIECFAFEPIPHTFSHLQRNIEINNFSRIQAFNLGLSNIAGQFSFSISPENSVGSFIDLKNLSGASQIINCEVTTIDGFISHAIPEPPDFIKCDVEGAELMVFQGAKNLLTHQRPAIFTEMLRKWAAKFDYHPNDMIRYFADLDYSCFVIRGERLLFFELVSDDTLDTNYIFLHKKHHAHIIDNNCYTNAF
jgi:FkbM family methyltransferase